MKNSWKKTLGAVALSAVALGAFAPTAFAFEEKGKGQHIDKGKPTPSAAKPKPADTPVDPPPPAVDYGQQGQHFDKGKPNARTAAGKTLAIVGGVVGLAAIVAVASSGRGSPKSP